MCALAGTGTAELPAFTEHEDCPHGSADLPHGYESTAPVERSVPAARGIVGPQLPYLATADDRRVVREETRSRGVVAAVH